MKSAIPLLALIFSFTLTCGCAASKVLNRPWQKDLASIRSGLPRGLVHAELGPPISIREVDGEKIDVFAFDKGVSGAWKIGRAIFHVAADFFTLCLWEVIAWPAESVAAGNNTKMEITYDKDERVKTVVYYGKKPLH